MRNINFSRDIVIYLQYNAVTYGGTTGYSSSFEFPVNFPPSFPQYPYTSISQTLGNFAPPYFGFTNSNAPPYFAPMTVPHYTSSEPIDA